MNFIREVLDIVSENEVIDSRKKIQQLVDEIKTYQNKIRTYINDNYVEFLPNLDKNQGYLDEGQRLIEEIEEFRQHIDDGKTDLLAANEEMEQYFIELHEISLELQTSMTILRIDELFKKLKEYKMNHEYLIVMSIIEEIKAFIDDPNDPILRQLDCFDNIKIQWFVEREDLLYILKERLDSLVQLKEKTFKKTKSVSLKISKDKNQLKDTIIALMNCKYNPGKMCDFLLNNMFGPIIQQPVSIDIDEKKDDFMTLTLSFGLEPLADDLRPNYAIVFRNIKTVLTCLGHMNVQMTDNESVLSNMGTIMKEKFLDMLKNDCLAHSLPDTMDEMNESTMISDILAFNQFLCDNQFFNADDNDLPDFAEKIGILFKHRFCTKILDEAIEIMHKNLHDMMLIDELTVVPIVGENAALFPKCMVSRNSAELISLMEKVLRQSTTATDELKQRLLMTIPTILERYITEVPTHHARLLHAVPQQTALFHNNCMYLAYWLSKNGKKEEISTFGPIIIDLQKCGSDQFLLQIQNQREQLMEILKDFDLTGVTSELDVHHQKVIRQCLRQLDLLKNVWQSILPDIVYNKTMGNILNDFCSEVIRRIFVVEDIPSNVSKGLVDICDVIIERSPYLFQDRLQISVLVSSWTKLTQLKMILNSSLLHITDQWADGKGPLTLHYKAEEVRHLIRALFQNTDRRANALASIY